MAKSKEECIREAGRILAMSRAVDALMTPREQAEAAWTPTSPYTVDELELLIRRQRGEDVEAPKPGAA